MYAWLDDALDDGGQVITASRRLARDLIDEYGRRRLAEGLLAWRSPAIRAWRDWLGDLLVTDIRPECQPLRLGPQHERVLWERCLRREVPSPLVNISLLVRQAREAWHRLHEYRVPLDVCRAAARSRDDHVFAAAARAYHSILEREHWIDAAGLAGLLSELAKEGRLSVPGRATLAGFDRIAPQVETLFAAIRGVGAGIGHAPQPERRNALRLRGVENPDAEMRIVGRWAGNAIDVDSSQRIGVVLTTLEQDAGRSARLLREGLVPGWQSGTNRHKGAVNVSVGRRLADYPACVIAMLLLRWLAESLNSKEVSLLLRSALLGDDDVDARSRVEIRLRYVPNRSWTLAMFLREFAVQADARPAWASRLDALDRIRGEFPQRARPSYWARLFDEALVRAGWPGPEKLDSAGFQLVNRWREMLNEFARLDLVSTAVSVTEALQRLGTMCAEVVFQPEPESPRVQLLGPLDAAGMEFDRLWIAGLDANSWPPPRRPLALLSRQLQRDFGMPEADPGDVLESARRLLDRLAAAAPEVRCSYAQAVGDAEQLPSALAAEDRAAGRIDLVDPGWHAARLVDRVNTIVADADPVPALQRGETVAGGAATLQLQRDDPFAAFAQGRLGVRLLPAITDGLSAAYRGKLIHESLYRLYHHRPARDAVAEWSESEIVDRIGTAAQHTFARHGRNADRVLRALLELEYRRTTRLLEAVVDLDRKRPPFEIVAVESSRDATIDGVTLRLRIDRIDRHDDGTLAIIDYKTGVRRRLLDSNGDPNDLQLVVYSYALDAPVGDLALLNVDSRHVDFDGAGVHFTPDLDWAGLLSEWRDSVAAAARSFRRGDVRLYDRHDIQSARPLALLSRIAEIRHG